MVTYNFLKKQTKQASARGWCEQLSTDDNQSFRAGGVASRQTASPAVREDRDVPASYQGNANAQDISQDPHTQALWTAFAVLRNKDAGRCMCQESPVGPGFRNIGFFQGRYCCLDLADSDSMIQHLS